MSSRYEQIIKDITQAIKQAQSGPKAYDTAATVVRVDGNTVWVHIPGGVAETPAARTVSASVGDVVQVRVSNGKAFLVGNSTSPPSDNSYELEQAINISTLAEKQAAELVERADSGEFNGKSVVNIVISYGVSKFNDVPPTSFSEDVNETSKLSETFKYLWTYNTVYYSDGTSSTTEPAVTGAYGDTTTMYKMTTAEIIASVTAADPVTS